MAQRATRPHTFLGIPNSWDCIAPVKDHTKTIQEDEHNTTVIQHGRTVGNSVDIGCDDNDPPRKAVDVIQLPGLTFRTKKKGAKKTHTFSYPTPHAQLNQFVFPARATAIGICDIAT